MTPAPLRIGAIPGDGIGAEMLAVTLPLLERAAALERACADACADPAARTADIGGEGDTESFAAAIEAALAREAPGTDAGSPAGIVGSPAQRGARSRNSP